MNRFSHLLRVFDPRIPTHRLVVLVGSGSAALSLLLDRDIGAAILAGVAAAVGWAVTRELAPDDGTAAIIAAIGAGAFQATVGGVGLGAVYVTIVALRVMVRTTGAAPLPTDLAFNLPVVALVSRSIAGLGMSLALALALWVSPTLEASEDRARRWWSVAYAAASVAGFLALASDAAPEPGVVGWIIVALSAVLSLPLVAQTTPRSVGDIDGEPLDGRRLRLGRIGTLTALGVVTVASLGGSNALLAPVWLAAGVSGLRELTARSAS